MIESDKMTVIWSRLIELDDRVKKLENEIEYVVPKSKLSYDSLKEMMTIMARDLDELSSELSKIKAKRKTQKYEVVIIGSDDKPKVAIVEADEVGWDGSNATFYKECKVVAKYFNIEEFRVVK